MRTRRIVLMSRGMLYVAPALFIAVFLQAACAGTPQPRVVPPEPEPQSETVETVPFPPPPEVKAEPLNESVSEAEPIANSEVLEYESVFECVVPGNANWTDTGIDVTAGQRIYIKAEGSILLQKGNPTAYCGPDGYNLRTALQPLPDRNIGALLGRIVRLLSIEKDPETEEEIRNEIVETFYSGAEGEITIPLEGRLYLGINENVVGDNDGRFSVKIFFLAPKG